jgi:hypothetical protein
MSDEPQLRAKVSQHLSEQKLPSRAPDRIWGGPGVGAPCAVCEQPVTRSEMEFEVEFARDGSAPHFDVFHVHLRCFAVWELVRREKAQPQP